MMLTSKFQKENPL